MPFYRKPYAKKSTYRRPYRRQPMTTKRVAKIARHVTRVDKPTKEYRKNNGGTLNTLTPPNSGIHYLNLVDISPGDLKDQRTSNKIYLAGIKLTMSLQNDSVTAPRYCRVLLLHTTNRDGDLLDVSGWTDLLQDNDRADYTPTGLSGDSVCPINTDIVKPLYDRVWKLGKDGDSSSAVHIQKWIPVRQYVRYDNEGGSPMVTSGLYYLVLMMIEPSNVASSTPLKYNYMTRLFFKDA